MASSRGVSDEPICQWRKTLSCTQRTRRAIWKVIRDTLYIHISLHRHPSLDADGHYLRWSGDLQPLTLFHRRRRDEYLQNDRFARRISQMFEQLEVGGRGDRGDRVALRSPLGFITLAYGGAVLASSGAKWMQLVHQVENSSSNEICTEDPFLTSELAPREQPTRPALLPSSLERKLGPRKEEENNALQLRVSWSFLSLLLTQGCCFSARIPAARAKWLHFCFVVLDS